MTRQPPAILMAALGWGGKYRETCLVDAAYHKFGLLEKLQLIAPEVHLHATLKERAILPSSKTLNYIEKREEVVAFDRALANEIEKCYQAGFFPLVLGGDHSLAVGTWSGLTNVLKAKQEFGLIWIDAHMDAHTPETTPSHSLCGMPVAALLGYGEASLVNLVASGAKLNPEHVVLLGIRSFEPEEAAFLNKLKVKIFAMPEIRERGLAAVFADALAIVSRAKGGFGVSIDLDALDPRFTPGVSYPEENGLELEALSQELHKISSLPQFKALEIVEYNPSRDQAFKTAESVTSLIAAILK